MPLVAMTITYVQRIRVILPPAVFTIPFLLMMVIPVQLIHVVLPMALLIHRARMVLHVPMEIYVTEVKHANREAAYPAYHLIAMIQMLAQPILAIKLPVANILP